MDASTIESAYRARTPTSADLAWAASATFPSGITHDSRYLLPYGLYVSRAHGARKWDVDDNEYVDFFGGHGALLLGHNDARVVAAAHAAVDAGSHFAASTDYELRWAQRVQQLVPSAERVRFTASGTEATLLALRLARAATGRSHVVRFRTHFHGWHDHMISGFVSHLDGSPAPGVLPGIAEATLLHDPGDTAAVQRTLSGRDDVAAVIVEPTGGQMGLTPLSPDFLHELERLCRAHGVAFILDEVVTGFRVAPGGAQAALGLRPDLTTLGKILTGGHPGGALVGRREFMDLLDHRAAQAAGREKVGHAGTFNAHPVTAAAGTATLEAVADSDACERATQTAAALRERVNAVFAQERIPWAVYGTHSMFHLFMNPEGRTVDPEAFDASAIPIDELRTRPPELLRRFRLAMLVHGVDLNVLGGGVVSTAHGTAELETIEAAVHGSLGMLRTEDQL